MILVELTRLFPDAGVMPEVNTKREKLPAVDGVIVAVQIFASVALFVGPLVALALLEGAVTNVLLVSPLTSSE